LARNIVTTIARYIGIGYAGTQTPTVRAQTLDMVGIAK
jgi:hypothetical protein